MITLQRNACAVYDTEIKVQQSFHLNELGNILRITSHYNNNPTPVSLFIPQILSFYTVACTHFQ